MRSPSPSTSGSRPCATSVASSGARRRAGAHLALSARLAATAGRAVVAVRWLVLGVGSVLLRPRSRGSAGSSRTRSRCPGTDSERVRACSSEHFGDSATTARSRVVFRVDDSSDAALGRGCRPRSTRASCACRRRPGAAASRRRPHVVYGDVVSTARARRREGAHRRAVRERSGDPPGVEALRHRPPAIQHDLDPIFDEDLLKGESIALPIALARAARRLRALARRH